MVVIETTALKAHGTPAALPPSAGSVMISAQTATASTEYTGTWRLSTLLHSRQPGIARSRENAYHVRDALVRPAVTQKICPMTAIMITSLAAQETIAVVKIATGKPAPLSTAFVSLAANRNPSSRIQRISAEKKIDRHTPWAAAF